MESNTNNTVQTKENLYPFFVSIRFRGSDKSYFFSTSFSDLKPGDLVVVETISGYEIGTVCTTSTPLSFYHSSLELKPILRRPNKGDMSNYEYNLAQGKKALEICRRDVEVLGLAMDLIDAVYTLDGEKVTITYTSPEKRVDFRELLHMLAPELGCRVELRQIANRDKAKMIGGIGICGLPLCCSTFLNSFEGISIQRAKNQMLTINIPKLSGPCDKLICCLLYEDDAYTEAKKEFPRHGEVIHTPEGDYSVDSFNVLSKNVRLVNATRDDYKTYPLEDIRAMQRGTYKKKEEDGHLHLELPDYNIGGRSFNESNDRNQKPNKDNNPGRKNNQNNKNRKGNNQPNRGPSSSPNNRPQQGNHNSKDQRNNKGNHRNFHGKHRPNRGPSSPNEGNKKS